MDPDAIERNERPGNGERGWTRLTAEASIEYVHDGAAGQPVVEIAKDDTERIPHRIEIVHDLPHLKAPLVHAQAEMRREHMHQVAADVDRRGNRTARLAPLH